MCVYFVCVCMWEVSVYACVLGRAAGQCNCQMLRYPLGGFLTELQHSGRGSIIEACLLIEDTALPCPPLFLQTLPVPVFVIGCVLSFPSTFALEP